MIKRFLISAFVAISLLFGFGSVVGAQDECPASSDEICDTDVLPGGLPGTEDTPEVVSPIPETEVLGRQQLPVTGAETVTIVLGGAALVLAGGVLVRRSNRVQA